MRDVRDDEEQQDGEQPHGFLGGAPGTPREIMRGLALGLVSCTPLFLAYELSLQAAGNSSRSTAELVLFRGFAALGAQADLARRILLACLVLTSLAYLLKRHVGLVPALTRVLLEGLLGAVVIGPLLIGLMRLMVDLSSQQGLTAGPQGFPEASRAAFVFGVAAHEELLFRLLLYSLFFLITMLVVRFLGAARGVARWAAELGGLLGSALVFAALHVESVAAWFKLGGDPFDPRVFTWRLLAGILLGVLFRWRGPGVAAWAHALFNVALLTGVHPDIFI